MFSRKPARDPIGVTMSGVRMGERLLQLGLLDQTLAGALAGKVGLSGTAAVAVADETGAAGARKAATRSGVLVDVRVSPLDALPFEPDTFDIVFIHGADGFLPRLGPSRTAVLAECRRVLRHRGRVIAVEPGTRTGLGAMLRPARPDVTYESSGGTVAAFEAAGFKPVRVVGDLEGLRFVEGLKTA